MLLSIKMNVAAISSAAKSKAGKYSAIIKADPCSGYERQRGRTLLGG